jgi:hypothetical protein
MEAGEACTDEEREQPREDQGTTECLSEDLTTSDILIRRRD